MNETYNCRSAQIAKAGGFRFLAILPTINHYGGVISILNMLEEFTELGHHCTLVTKSKYAKLELVTRFSPIWLSEPDAAVQALRGRSFDFVIASSWDTVDMALALADAADAVPIYFVQDIESDFWKGLDEERYLKALATYDQIDVKIVKTRHLKKRLQGIGSDAHVIRPGMNRNVFYPRTTTPDGTFRVLAMARPEAPNGQRGFPVLVEAFAKLCESHSHVRVGFFGHNELDNYDLPFPFTNFGQMSSRMLPPIYSWSDVYVDASRFHGFGRTGVEAMSCGSVVVLSDSGGISDYCLNGDNGLIVPVDDPDAVVAAVQRLMNDAPLRSRLRERALQTVQFFDDRLAATEFISVCLAAIDERRMPSAELVECAGT